MVVRLYRELVDRVCDILDTFKDRHPEEFANSIPLGERDLMPLTPDEILVLLEKQLTTAPAEQDLIDKIVEMLELPYLQNRVGSGTLQRLREMILLPQELDKLADTLQTEWICSGCGVKMFAGELAVLMQSDNGRGATVMCGYCAIPDYVRCKSGKHRLNPSKKFRHAYDSMREDCYECRQEAERPKPLVEQGRAPQVTNWFDELVALPDAPPLMPTAGRARGRAIQPFPTPRGNAGVGRGQPVAAPATARAGERIYWTGEQNAAAQTTAQAVLTAEQHQQLLNQMMYGGTIQQTQALPTPTHRLDDITEDYLDDDDGGDE